MSGAKLQQKIQPAPHPLRAGSALGKLEAGREMRHRLLVGRPAQFPLAGAKAIAAGRSRKAGFGEMKGQQFRLVRRQLREAIFERAGDALVQVATAAQQQAVVGRVAHQRMLEGIAAFRAAPLGKDDAGRAQLFQHAPSRSALPCTATASSSAKLNCRPMTEATCATSRAWPRRSSRAISESFERRGHRRAVLARRFHHAPGQFLDEQGHAVGLGDDRLRWLAAKAPA